MLQQLLLNMVPVLALALAYAGIWLIVRTFRNWKNERKDNDD